MKTRIISAAVLLPLLMIMILALPTWVTAVVLGLALAVAAYELLYATGILRHARLVIYCGVAAFLMSIWSWAGMDRAWGLLLILAFFCAVFAETMASHIKLAFEQVTVCFVAGLVIPFLMTGLIRILIVPRLGRYYIVIPFLMAFLPDSGAYFAGRFFGKHKLAPVISPKKTVEGAVGGAVACVQGMLLYALILQFGFHLQVDYLWALVYGVIGSLASVFGDLCFSLIKRQTGIKDYSNLIPGHGGILDRLDSMTVVAPLCEALLLLIPMAVR